MSRVHRHRADHARHCPRHTFPQSSSVMQQRNATQGGRKSRTTLRNDCDGRQQGGPYTAPQLSSASECDEPAATDTTGRCSNVGTSVGVRSVCVVVTTGPAE